LKSGMLQESRRDVERRDRRVCCLIGVVILRANCWDKTERAVQARDT
jgi:hypothetical protein